MARGHSELDDARLDALAVAREAGEVIVQSRAALDVRHKADGSEVTDADTRAEEFIRGRLSALAPSVPILGEEFGGEPSMSGDQWIIDPIDGTTHFALGSPMYGTLIALVRDGDPLVGVIHFPSFGETVSAASGSGCWFEASGQTPVPCRASSVENLSDAFVSTSGLHATGIEPIAGQGTYNLASLARRARKLRVIGDCFQHALVCRGRIELAVDAIMAPWDSAALIPCVREAGGAIADLEGKTDGLAFAGSLVSAACDALLGEALTTMTVRDSQPNTNP